MALTSKINDAIDKYCTGKKAEVIKVPIETCGCDSEKSSISSRPRVPSLAGRLSIYDRLPHCCDPILCDIASRAYASSTASSYRSRTPIRCPAYYPSSCPGRRYVPSYTSLYTSRYVSPYTARYCSSYSPRYTSEYSSSYVSPYASRYTSSYVSPYSSRYTTSYSYSPSPPVCVCACGSCCPTRRRRTSLLSFYDDVIRPHCIEKAVSVDDVFHCGSEKSCCACVSDGCTVSRWRGSARTKEATTIADAGDWCSVRRPVLSNLQPPGLSWEDVHVRPDILLRAITNMYEYSAPTWTRKYSQVKAVIPQWVKFKRPTLRQWDNILYQ